jgi:uncharacterized protein
VSPGPYLPLDGAPMLVGDISTLADHIRPVPGRPMTFTASEIVRPAETRSLELVPFFRVHDSRYMIYWRAVAPDKYSAVLDRMRAEEEERLALEARTIDRVTPGEQQPEIEHRVRSDGSTTGSTNGRTWREASGWFSYDLTLAPDAPRPAPGNRRSASRAAVPGSQGAVSGGPLELRVTYSAGQRNRQFDIRVNDRVIATVTLNGEQPDRFLDAAYPVPADVVSAATNGVLTVTFAAKPGSRAGAVYDVRLLAGR